MNFVLEEKIHQYTISIHNVISMCLINIKLDLRVDPTKEPCPGFIQKNKKYINICGFNIPYEKVLKQYM